MTVDDDLIRLIDQRIRLAQVRDRAGGACVSRAASGPGADVLFDGSTVAMPVKVLGSVFLTPGDRCVLEKFGTEWIVTGSFSAFGLGESSFPTVGPVGGTGVLTSASFVDVQEIPPILFDKAFDGTYVRIGLTASAYCETTANTAVQFGLRFTPMEENGTAAQDITLNKIFFNAVLDHEGNYYNGRLAPFQLLSGRYSVQLRWRRTTGTGGIKADQEDQFAIEIDEGVATAVPIL